MAMEKLIFKCPIEAPSITGLLVDETGHEITKTYTTIAELEVFDQLQEAVHFLWSAGNEPSNQPSWDISSFTIFDEGSVEAYDGAGDLAGYCSNCNVPYYWYDDYSPVSFSGTCWNYDSANDRSCDAALEFNRIFNYKCDKCKTSYEGSIQPQSTNHYAILCEDCYNITQSGNVCCECGEYEEDRMQSGNDRLYCYSCYYTYVDHYDGSCWHDKYTWKCDVEAAACGATGTYCSEMEPVESCPQCGQLVSTYEGWQ